MKTLLKWLPAVAILAGLTVYSSCQEDPNPNTGIDFSPQQLFGTWSFETVELEGRDQTEEFAPVRITFEQSAALNFTRNGQPLDVSGEDQDNQTPVWIATNSLTLSIDFELDTTLRKLNGIYVATDTGATRMAFIVQNPRTPGVLVLVR